MTYTERDIAHEMGRLRQIYQSLPFEEFLFVAAQDILTERFKARAEDSVLEAVNDQ